MRGQQTSAGRALYYALWVAFWLVFPNRLPAAFILPTDAEVTEMMMTSEQETDELLARMASPDLGGPGLTSPLTFSGIYSDNFTNKTFSFALTPTIYNGNLVTASASGHFDSSSGQYIIDANSGAFGNTTFALDPNSSSTISPDPSYKISWPIKKGGIVLGTIDAEAKGDFDAVTDPTGTTVKSTWSISLTWNGGMVAGAMGKDTRNPDKGWQFSYLAPNNPTGGPVFTPFDIEVVGTPTVADGSAGMFTGTISAVPEPASSTLLGLGVAGVLGYAWRRRKRATT